jgi:hypothetical protein
MPRKKAAPAQQAELLPMKDVTPAKSDAAKVVNADQAEVRQIAREANPKKASGQAVAVAQPQAPKSLAEMLMTAAHDPSVNADKARAMFDLYKDVEAHEAKTAFTTAFIALQKRLPAIDKDGKIDHGQGKQKNLYATYPNIMKVVKPLLDEYGFALASTVEPGADGKIEIVSYLDHERGHQRKSTFPLAAETSGSKNNVQGWGSSQSYGMRYNAIALLNIVSQAPGDRDTDGNFDKDMRAAKGGGFVEATEVARITKAQADELVRAMEFAELAPARFLEHYGIAKVGDLPADLFPAAKKKIKDYQDGKASR